MSLLFETLPLWSFAAAFVAGSGLGVVAFRNGAPKPPADHFSDVAESKKTTFMFSGTLTQTPLLEAIQFLEIQRREGVLHVFCGRRKGYLVFADGAVIDGFWRNQTGREAVIHMFAQVEGDFYFEPKPILQPRVVQDSAMDLAFEWDGRRMSGWVPNDD